MSPTGLATLPTIHGADQTDGSATGCEVEEMTVVSEAGLLQQHLPDCGDWSSTTVYSSRFLTSAKLTGVNLQDLGELLDIGSNLLVILQCPENRR